MQQPYVDTSVPNPAAAVGIVSAGTPRPMDFPDMWAPGFTALGFLEFVATDGNPYYVPCWGNSPP